MLLGDKLQSMKLRLNPVLSIEMEREKIRCRRIERKNHGKWKRKKEKTLKLRFRENCDFCER